MLYVCSLSKLEETASQTGAKHLVTLINSDMDVPTPQGIASDRHLFLGFNDIVSPIDGLTPPSENHVERLLEFVNDWDRAAPLIIHCWAGISRSTAGAYIAACSLMPSKSEQELADMLRATAPSATPNARLVAIADNLLGRDGRMVSAIQSIGRGANAFEGTPFRLPIE